MINPAFIFVALASVCLADESPILPESDEATTVTPPLPSKPYSFEYSAGRFPGHVDRGHQESSDGSGVVRGSFWFIDPKQKNRTVKYTADKNGFHPSFVNYEDIRGLPVNTKAVKLANEKHFALYNKIAEDHSQGLSSSYLPKDTDRVAKAKAGHLALFAKIAADHPAIAAETTTERLPYEATSVPNDVEEPDQIYDN